MPGSRSISTLGVLFASAALLAIGLWGVIWGVALAPKFAWAYVAFHGVLALAGGVGAQILRHDLRAPALLSLCMAGAAVGSALLSTLALRYSFGQTPLPRWSSLAHQATLGVGGLLLLTSVGFALKARPGGARLMLRAALLLVIAGALAGATLYLVRPVLTGSGARAMIHLVLATLVFLVFTGFLAAGAHALIHALTPGNALQRAEAKSQQPPS